MSSIYNQIHIFSVEDFQLKHCIGEDIQISKIMNVAFSKKNKFLSLLFDDLNIQIFNLTAVKSNPKDICKCKKNKKESKSIFTGLVSNLKVKNLLIIK